MTNALSQADSAPFVDAGFAVRERLHLLAHDLDHLPPQNGSHGAPAVTTIPRSSTSTRRRSTVIWRLDNDGLVEALRATPVDALSCHT